MGFFLLFWGSLCNSIEKSLDYATIATCVATRRMERSWVAVTFETSKNQRKSVRCSKSIEQGRKGPFSPIHTYNKSVRDQSINHLADRARCNAASYYTNEIVRVTIKTTVNVGIDHQSCSIHPKEPNQRTLLKWRYSFKFNNQILNNSNNNKKIKCIITNILLLLLCFFSLCSSSL